MTESLRGLEISDAKMGRGVAGWWEKSSQFYERQQTEARAHRCMYSIDSKLGIIDLPPGAPLDLARSQTPELRFFCSAYVAREMTNCSAAE